jgi:c-di-GMP-binding flagellar brake protein YcgR
MATRAQSTSSGPGRRSGGSSGTAADDRRRSVRVPQRGSFAIRPLLSDGVGAAVTVVLVDLSQTGMGVLHAQPLHVGTQFQIPLTREIAAGAAEPISLVCTVVRCEKLDEELYSIGFEFNSSAAAVNQASMQLTGKPARRE